MPPSEIQTGTAGSCSSYPISLFAKVPRKGPSRKFGQKMAVKPAYTGDVPVPTCLYAVLMRDERTGFPFSRPT